MEHKGNRLGAAYLGENACRFRVWAPSITVLGVQLLQTERLVPLERTGGGYYETVVENVHPGDSYLYQLGRDKQRPDPASRFQPRGVHGPSTVVDSEFPWGDGDWSGIALEDYIIYELHVGCFSPAGTFEAVIPFLDYLKDVGITAVELMPVAQFPGTRNWGYDGVFPFAAQNSYGGPEGLKKLVNACHQRGLAVILDVVYNHLGPEGNYLPDFGPYFTERYKTPWGSALNFDGAFSDEVRQFFVQNALYWLVDCHFDALRLDAVHAILDYSPITFLEDLSVAVHAEAERLHRRMFLIAESAANDARLVRERERGGYGLNAQWNDEFHHCLRTLLTGEKSGYYSDYGRFDQLTKAYREGFAYSGEYSEFRGHRHGSSSRDLPAERFVVFAQNHDQVGNRMRGDRLTETVSFDDLKLAAGLVILSPYIPLLFMGEEYGEQAPFPYFVSHSDAGLIEAVRNGRRMEFASFAWQGEIPDPQDEATFVSAKLRHELQDTGEHRILLDFYRELIRLRKTTPALAELSKENMEVTAVEEKKMFIVQRCSGGDRALMIANLASTEACVELSIPAGRWHKVMDSAEPIWRGSGSTLANEINGGAAQRFALPARSLALFRREING
jgi:maltooligosyltrehalose trehalohydrolase